MTALWDWIESKLARVTTSGEIIREIDGFRAIAIGMVILHHLLALYLQNTGRFGYVLIPAAWSTLRAADPVIRALYPSFLGVQLFFVISGFVLGLPFARHYLRGHKKPQPRAYFLRRVTRLEPPYILAATVFFVARCFTGNVLDLLPHFVATLFYSHSILYGAPSVIEGIFWSLEVEVQFYILAPLLAMLFSIRNAVARRFVLVAIIYGWAMLASQVTAVTSSRLSLTLVGYGHYFMAGFLLVEVYLSWLEDRAFTPSELWDFVAVACGVALNAVYWTNQSWRYVWTMPFIIVLLYVALFRGRFGGPLMRARPVYLIGGMCYTTYLYHIGLLGIVSAQSMKLWNASIPFAADLAVQGLALVPVVLAICAVIYYYTEKPFMVKRWH
ncbi:MAG: acyltransferase [Acidobacteria bacterium]|nr:acyltransferase [Acidobacteriota bacterium]